MSDSEDDLVAVVMPKAAGTFLPVAVVLAIHPENTRETF